MMDWKKFLEVSSEHLAHNPCKAVGKWSWCAWTTFERLGEDAGYWTASLPLESEILEVGISDSGAWGQPFRFSQLAHIILPRRFYWEQISAEGFSSGIHEQDVDGLSERLIGEGVVHRLSQYALEVKLY